MEVCPDLAQMPFMRGVSVPFGLICRRKFWDLGWGGEGCGRNSGCRYD
jgi:hypothetical protein